MRTIEVVRPGMLTTVQDWPGRVGYWHVGVPPSGPMDDLSFRVGNRVLGNPEGAAGLECTKAGPALRFPDGGRVCVAGAAAPVTLDGTPVPMWQSITVPAGGVLDVGMVPGPGMRCYVLIAGGLLRARIPRQLSDVHPGLLRRSRRPPAARGRPAGRGRRCRPGVGPAGACRHRRAARDRPPLAGRRHRRPARRTGILHPRRYGDDRRHGLHRALQLRSHRCAPDGPQAAVGPHRRRRGRTAPVEHPRQCLLRRHFGLHRRHPDPAGPRRSQPRRVRLPGHRGAGRSLEARADGPRRHRAVRAGARRPGSVAGQYRRQPAGVDAAGDLHLQRRRRRCADPIRRHRGHRCDRAPRR